MYSSVGAVREAILCPRTSPGASESLPSLLALLLFTEKSLERGHIVSSGPVPHIFVVDDEHVIASTLAAILQMNGFSAKFFTCPLEALTAARLKAPDLAHI
jgi:hypothetical protein